MYTYDLHFSLNSTDNSRLLPENGEVDIYETFCTNLSDLYEVAIIEEGQRRLTFENCSNSGSNICVLDQFFYEIDADFSTVSYIVSLDSAFVNHTKMEIVAFDDLDNFKKYMDSGSSTLVDPVKQVTMKSKIYEFTLTSGEMRRSSYYFVTIHNVWEHTKSLILKQCGIHVHYNRSTFGSPKCTLDFAGKKNCTLKIKDAKDETCYLAHYRKPSLEEFRSEDLPPHLYVTSKRSNYKRTSKGEMWFDIGFGTLAASVMTVILGLLICPTLYAMKLESKSKCSGNNARSYVPVRSD